MLQVPFKGQFCLQSHSLWDEEPCAASLGLSYIGKKVFVLFVWCYTSPY